MMIPEHVCDDRPKYWDGSRWATGLDPRLRFPTLEDKLDALLSDGWELARIFPDGQYFLRLSDWASDAIENCDISTFLHGNNTIAGAAEQCYSLLQMQLGCYHDWAVSERYVAQCVNCFLPLGLYEWRERNAKSGKQTESREVNK